jgi:hypothetical protein
MAAWEKSLARLHLHQVDLVAYICNPSYEGGIGRKITGQSTLDKNMKLHLKNN